MIARRKTKTNTPQSIQSKQFQPSINESSRKDRNEFSKPQTKNMIVLGELNRGVRTFENIQKNTGFDSKELDTVLEDLEKKGMLRIQQKQKLFGIKIELYPTDKGVKEYYS